LLAAQGYQESTLDQNKKSQVGAIGTGEANEVKARPSLLEE
jgi:hypothetical protein